MYIIPLGICLFSDLLSSGNFEQCWGSGFLQTCSKIIAHEEGSDLKWYILDSQSSFFSFYPIFNYSDPIVIRIHGADFERGNNVSKSVFIQTVQVTHVRTGKCQNHLATQKKNLANSFFFQKVPFSINDLNFLLMILNPFSKLIIFHFKRKKSLGCWSYI